MTNLIWTDEKPKRPGWYWYRFGELCQVAVIKINEKDCEHFAAFPKSHAEYAGPIPEPTDAAQPHYIDPAVRLDGNERLK